jgi:hypothetical protein
MSYAQLTRLKIGSTYSLSALSAFGFGTTCRLSGLMVIVMRRFSLQQERILGSLFLLKWLSWPVGIFGSREMKQSFRTFSLPSELGEDASYMMPLYMYIE